MKSHFSRCLLWSVLFTVLFSCSRKAHLSALEEKIFVLVPETAAPDDGLPAERIKLKVKDRTLFANWVSAGNKAPAFFILHGNGEMLTEWRPLQAYLLKQGYSSFVVDYSGFGSSTGKPTVRILNEDVLYAYKQFSLLTAESAQRIIFSHSLGGAMLLDMAHAFKPMPDKIVLHGAFSSGREIIVEKKIVQAGEEKSYPDFWNGLKRVKRLKLPVYVVHSPNDKTIPLYMGEALAKAAGRNGRFLSLNTAGHNTVYQHPNDSTWQPILDFIR